MPINPNTRYALESKLIEGAFLDCQSMASIFSKFIKRSSILYFVSSLITLACIVISMILNFSFLYIYFIVILLLLFITIIGFIRLSNNIMMKPTDYEEIVNIIYGDTYSIVEVNPEKLFNYTSILRRGEGKAIEYIKIGKLLILMSELILLSICISSILLLIFG